MEGKGGQEPGIQQGSLTGTWQVENRGHTLGTSESFSYSLYKPSLNLSRVSGTLLGTVGGGGHTDVQDVLPTQGRRFT